MIFTETMICAANRVFHIVDNDVEPLESLYPLWISIFTGNYSAVDKVKGASPEGSQDHRK